MSEIPKENPGLELVKERTKNVLKNCKDPNYAVQSFSNDEFSEACKVLSETCSLNEGILPPNLLRERLRWLNSEIGSLHVMFNPKISYFLTPYPTTPRGNKLDSRAVDAHAYFHTFMVNIKNGYTSNFSGDEAKFYELLPPYIKKKCQLAIPTEWAGDFQRKGEQSKILRNSYGEAYNNLRKFLGLPGIDIEQLMKRAA